MKPEVFDALPLEERDRETVERLQKHGDELGRARRVTHTFLLNEHSLLTGLLDSKMENFGFWYQDRDVYNLGNGYAAQARHYQRMQAVDLDTVQRMTRMCREAALAAVASYSGWQTQPVRALDDRGNA